MEGVYWVILEFHHDDLIMNIQWWSKLVNVGDAACSLRFYLVLRNCECEKWWGVSVGDISEWWLRWCGAAAGRLVVWVQEGFWSTMCSRRSWTQEDGNIRPACSTRMSIGGGLWMCDFICCTFGQLRWVLHDSSLCPLVLLVHPESKGLFFLYILNLRACMKLLLLFSAQEECWSPGAASGGGQLHQAGEESRASLQECSSWMRWSAGRSIGR